jgi:hypothetical protein
MARGDALATAFVERDLRALDAISAEVLVATLHVDDRPIQGVGALWDFRAAGRLSRVLRAGFVRGEVFEQAMIPAGSALPVDKLIVVGLGPRASFDDAIARAVTGRILATLAGLAVRRAIVELPGRGSAMITAPRAVEILAAALDEAERGRLESLAIVDEREAARAIDDLRLTPGRRSPAARR